MTGMLTEDRPIEGDTRDRLLEAGLRLFAARGFDSVSTRELTRAAGVNIAAIGYHFGGKEELYLAVIQRQVEETEPLIGPVTRRLVEAVRASKGDRETLARVAAGFVTGMLRAFLGNERMRLRAAVVLREYAQPSEAFTILFKGRMESLHKAVTELAAAAIGRDPEEPESVIRAHAIMGQIIIFFIARVVLWARLGCEDYDAETLERIERELTASVIASLGLPQVAAAGVGS